MATDPAIPCADPPIGNPLGDLLGYQLRRASAVVVADLAHTLADLVLRPTEASVLLLIGANPGVTQSDIGRELAIKRANMAPIAAMLSDRGLIDRTRPDGRSQGLMLSEAGTTLAIELRRRIDEHEARFLPDLSPRDRAALTALVRRVWTV